MIIDLELNAKRTPAKAGLLTVDDFSGPGQGIPEVLKFAGVSLSKGINYILAAKRAVVCLDLVTWAVWMKTNSLTVAFRGHGAVSVTTTFLGLDQTFGKGPQPVLFKTEIVGGKYAGCLWFHSTWDEAESGHYQVCDKVWPKVEGSAP